ncbi:MAG: flagellar hook-length control protein FliK, partial [Pseudomonadota bacterium]
RNLVDRLPALLWPDHPDAPIPAPQPPLVHPRESSPILVAKPTLLPSQVPLPAEDSPSTAESLAPPGRLDNESRALREISQQGEAALARVRYHQLASLPSHDGTKVVWHLEIPVQVAGQTQSFECRIEEEDESAGRGKGEGRGFTVDLAFDFSALGPSHARVRVRANQVGVVFWAERQATVVLMHDHLEQLAARLRAVGLEVGLLQAYQGKPPRPVVSRPVIPPLLDEKA